MSTLLIILIVLLLIGVPYGGYAYGGPRYGFGASGLVGLVVIVFLILALTGRVSL